MFWTNYLYLCNSIGKTPNAVAAECGIKSTGTVTGWKNGSQPRQGAAYEIAKYFGVEVSALTGEDLTKKEKPALHSEAEHDEFVSVSIDGLTAEEAAILRAYAAGLKASRSI